MKYVTKKIITMFLLLVLLFCSLPANHLQAANTSGSFEQRISQLQQKFPSGTYWNHIPGSQNNPDGYTNNPCTHHGNCSKKGYNGWCGCNSFNDQSIQCFGFAEKLGYDVFGTNPRTSWTTTYTISNVQAGDIIRYKNNGHSIFVTKVSGNTITFADCNSDGHCKIRWNATINKSNLTGFNYIKHANNYSNIINSPSISETASFRYCVDNAPSNGTTYHNPTDKISLSGWAITMQGNGEGVTGLDLCINGKNMFNCTRSQRDDVAKVYPSYPNGKNAGFSCTFNAELLNPGENTISLRAYATNSSKNDTPLEEFGKCTVYYDPDCNIVDNIDVVEGQKGSIILGGWAFDKDNPAQQLDIHVYIGGEAGSGAPCYIIKADKERPDIGNIYGVGNYHGYSDRIYYFRSGEQPVHLYAIDATGNGTKYLGCRMVTIEEDKAPVGCLDNAMGGTDCIKVSGWAYDEDDTSKPTWIHVYAGGPAGEGSIISNFLANKERTDLDDLFGVGDYHGFEEVIKTDLSGTQTLYFYAIDVLNGANNDLIGSKTVEIKQGTSPIGVIDHAEGRKGCISIGGWAYDRDDLSKSLDIHVYIGGDAGSGAPGYAICADEERKDVGSAENAGDYHGFDDIITTPQRGTQEVYIYAIDTGSSQPNVLLGHKSVVIEEPDVQEGHTHKYTEEIIKPVTCIEQGMKRYACSCGDSYTEIIDMESHTAVTDEAQAPSCEKDGISEGSHCSVCGAIIKAQEIIEKTNHSNTIVKYQKNASCVCAGYTGDTYCTDCGIKLEDGKILKQLEHTMDKGIVLKNATESEAGITIFTCTVCQTMGIKIIPSIGAEHLKEDANHSHTYVSEVIKVPTYNSPGESLHVCACGEYFAETVAVNKKPEVTPEVITEIRLNSGSRQLLRGQSFTLTAAVTPTNNSAADIIWESSDPKIADITPNGTVKAKAPGTATITATATDGGGAQAFCRITVPYSITYKLNRGSNHKANLSYYYKQNVVLKNPTRSGYTFSGWYTDSKCRIKITAITKSSEKDITLYAKWSKVKVKKTAIKKVANASGKKAKIILQKVNGAKGYKILYSTDKKMKKNVRTTNAKKTEITLSKLKKGKTYYIKACAYKLDSNNSKVYGAYGKTKTIKIRK